MVYNLYGVKGFMQKRMNWIDVAKGICMIAIVLGHLNHEWINRVVFSFHLPVLFILAGYTMEEQKSSSDYLNDKFNKLMKPYILTCIIICIADVIRSFLNMDYSISGITNIIYRDLQRSWMASGSIQTIGNYDLGSGIEAIWFLPAMFFALVFAQYILNGTKEWKERFLLGVILAFIANAVRYFLWLPFSILSGMFAAVFVVLGKWLKEQSVLEKCNYKHYLLCMVIFLISIVLDKSGIYVVSSSMKDYIITPVCSVASALLVIKAAMLLENSRFLRWIGENYILVLQILALEPEAGSEWYERLFSTNYFLVVAWMVIIVIVLAFNDLRKKRIKPRELSKEEVYPLKRDRTIDLYKGILIILMLIGHAKIDKGLRNIIYSFHMFAFVLLSGYFYRLGGSVKEKVIKLMKGVLKPYAIFCVLYYIFGNGTLKNRIITSLLGMSFSKNLFTEIESIGPVYFILMLFCIRFVFILVDHFTKNEMQRCISVFILSLFGYYLGKRGYWLPWSFDCALYCMIFYYFGFLLKKHNILEILRAHRYMYFPISAIWVFSLAYGALELATRKYLDYGFYIIGSVAGILVVYLLCVMLRESLSEGIQKMMNQIGQSTVYILMIHKLFGGKISMFIENVFSLNKTNIPHLFLLCLSQIVFGVLMGLLMNQLTKKNVKTG